MLKKQNKQPLISVIIPAYNEERYIKKCLQSLRNQFLKDFEIIVVDDGSTDLTYSSASEFGVKVIRLPHKGSGNARNFGAKVASGKILVFLDADMYVDKYYLKNIIKPIKTRRSISTYTTSEFVANQNNIWSRCWNINLNLPFDRRISGNDPTIGQAFRAILKDKFLELGGFNPLLGFMDDRSLNKFNIHPHPVNNAVCYHFNPETLRDVYFSARWIGRSQEFKFKLENLLKYSIINSIKISINKIFYGAPLEFIIFKIIFDLGIFTGILFKNPRSNFSK